MPVSRVFRTRVKICGITRVEDARAVVDAGADAIGLVFYPPSSRNIDPQEAAEIANAVSAFVSVTGLFMDATPMFIEQVIKAVPLGLLQFHGNETPEDCRRYGKPYIKAAGIGGIEDYPRFSERYSDAVGLLLDSHDAGEAGGTGKVFDWSRFPRESSSPLILAGGLHPDNVGAAIEAVSPYAVDLSSGVESAPGIKDSAKIQMLMNEVKRVDCERGFDL